MNFEKQFAYVTKFIVAHINWQHLHITSRLPQLDVNVASSQTGIFTLNNMLQLLYTNNSSEIKNKIVEAMNVGDVIPILKYWKIFVAQKQWPEISLNCRF